MCAQEELSFEEVKVQGIEVDMQNTTGKINRYDLDDEVSEMEQSINKDARQTQNSEVESAYTELDLTMHKARHSQLIAIPNSVCSVCNTEKDSCIILTNQCRH